MKKITTLNNWCEIDQLDGIDLKSNERLKVKFPNGQVIEVTCFIQESSYTTSDMGRPYVVPVKKATIRTKWKGQPCFVPIAGLEAERV